MPLTRCACSADMCNVTSVEDSRLQQLWASHQSPDTASEAADFAAAFRLAHSASLWGVPSVQARHTASGLFLAAAGLHDTTMSNKAFCAGQATPLAMAQTARGASKDHTLDAKLWGSPASQATMEGQLSSLPCNATPSPWHVDLCGMVLCAQESLRATAAFVIHWEPSQAWSCASNCNSCSRQVAHLPGMTLIPRFAFGWMCRWPQPWRGQR